ATRTNRSWLCWHGSADSPWQRCGQRAKNRLLDQKSYRRRRTGLLQEPPTKSVKLFLRQWYAAQRKGCPASASIPAAREAIAGRSYHLKSVVMHPKRRRLKESYTWGFSQTANRGVD